MATIEAASEQSAKLPPAGSTPAVASMLVMPTWWWEIARETWLSFRPEERVPEEQSVWVFNRTGEHQFFPCAVFSTAEQAVDWIVQEMPVGVLTRYVLNKPDNPDFPEHYHYEEPDDYAQRISTGQW